METMSKLTNCVILADETYFAEWEEFFNSTGDPDFPGEDIDFVDKENIHLVLASEKNKQFDFSQNFDYLMIEDEQLPAMKLARESVKSQRVNNLLIASSISCVEFLLKNKVIPPPVISLDFHLELSSNENPDQFNFKLTENLYKKIKAHWKTSKVIGFSAYINDSGEPGDLVKDLAMILRDYSDDIYPKLHQYNEPYNSDR